MLAKTSSLLYTQNDAGPSLNYQAAYDNEDELSGLDIALTIDGKLALIVKFQRFKNSQNIEFHGIASSGEWQLLKEYSSNTTSINAMAIAKAILDRVDMAIDSVFDNQLRQTRNMATMLRRGEGIVDDTQSYLLRMIYTN